VNAAGGVKGKKIDVRVYDNQSQARGGANAANRLINQDNVLLILGEVASSNSIAMATKAQPPRCPMISNASHQPEGHARSATTSSASASSTRSRAT
jgi:branched-chain amino acid transport system substrate-binding protein